MTRFLILAAFLGVLNTLPATASATTLKVVLIQAQNEGIADDVPQDAKIRKCLNKLFGYDHYAVLGEASGVVQADKPTSFRPTPTFHLSVKPDPRKTDSYHFEFFQEHKSLLQGSFIPKNDVPFIIRGPFYDKGQLVFVISKVAD